MEKDFQFCRHFGPPFTPVSIGLKRVVPSGTRDLGRDLRLPCTFRGVSHASVVASAV